MNKKLNIAALGLICSILAGSHTSLAMDEEDREFVQLTASEKGKEALASLYQAKACLAQEQIQEMATNRENNKETHSLSMQLVTVKLEDLKMQNEVQAATKELALEALRMQNAAQAATSELAPQLAKAQLEALMMQNEAQGEELSSAKDARKLSMQLTEQTLESSKMQNAAQEILNRRADETFFEHIGRPETIVRLSVAFAPLTPLVANWIYKKVYGDPEQQSIEQKLRLNNITIEQAELDLEVKKSKFKAQDMMQKLAIQNEAIKLHKEETKLQVVTSLTSLAEKEANGEELTDKQKEYYQICNKVFGLLSQNTIPQQQEAAAA